MSRKQSFRLRQSAQYGGFIDERLKVAFELDAAASTCGAPTNDTNEQENEPRNEVHESEPDRGEKGRAMSGIPEPTTFG